MLNMIIISWEYHKNMIRIDRNRSSYWIILIAHHSTKIYKRSWAHLHDNVILALQYPELVKGDARSLGDIVSLSLSPWTHKHCMVSIAWYLHLTMIQIAKRRLNKSKKKSVSWKKTPPYSCTFTWADNWKRSAFRKGKAAALVLCFTNLKWSNMCELIYAIWKTWKTTSLCTAVLK